MSEERILSTRSPSTASYQSIQEAGNTTPQARGSFGRGEVITQAAPEPGFNFRTAILERLRSCYEGVKDFFSWSFGAVTGAISNVAHYLDSFTSREKAERYNLEREVANEERLELLTERAEPQNFETEMKYVDQEIEDYDTQSQCSDVPNALQEAYKEASISLKQVPKRTKWTAETIAQRRKDAKDIIRKAKGLLNEVEKTEAALTNYEKKANKSSSDEARDKNQRAADILEEALNVPIDRNNREGAVVHLTEARKKAAAIVRLGVSDFDTTMGLLAYYKEREEANESSDLKLAYQSAGAILEEALYNPRSTPKRIGQAKEKAERMITLGRHASAFNGLLELKKDLFKDNYSTYRGLHNLYDEVRKALIRVIKNPKIDLSSIEETIVLTEAVVPFLEQIEAVIREYDLCEDRIDQMETMDLLSPLEEQEWKNIVKNRVQLIEATSLGRNSVRSNIALFGFENSDETVSLIRRVNAQLSNLKDQLEAFHSSLSESLPRSRANSIGYSDDGGFERESEFLQDRDSHFLQEGFMERRGSIEEGGDDWSVRNSELLQDDDNLLSEEGSMEAIIRGSSQEGSMERRNSIGESDDDWSVRNSELAANHDQGLRRGFSPSKRVSYQDVPQDLRSGKRVFLE